MPSLKPMPRCDRGNWIDAEGSLKTFPRAFLAISQKEREPLEDYCEGAKADGVPCKIWSDRKRNKHLAYITGLENIAKEILLTQPYIRTERKHKQIQTFKNYLTTPRKRPDIRVARARKILKI